MNAGRLSVLHVTEPVDGGVARCVLDLAGDQARRGWRVTVLAPPDPEFVPALEREGVDVLPWRLPQRRAGERHARVPGPALLRGVRAVAAAAERAGADLLHLHSSQAGLAGRIALRGRRPTVFQPHAWSFYALRGPARAGAVRWERLASRWAAATVCVSEGERLDGVRAGIRAAWHVIPNGVDLESLPPASPQDLRAARGRLGLADGPLVVSVGRVSPQKGQDVLLASWPAVATRVPGAKLALVGDGPDRTLLEARAPEGVQFVGERRDVADWLAAADVVAQPSRWEAGASLVLLEAMARARPVVTTSVSGAEAVDGAGAVVPIEDHDALARALTERLLDRERAEREGRAARERVVEKYDVRRTRDAVAALYEALLR